MFSKNNQISGRQLFRLLTYDLLGFGSLMIPTVLAGVSGRDGIFAVVIGVLLSLCYLKVLRYVFSDMNGTYEAYLKQELGSFVGSAFEVGYLIYFVLLAGYVAYLFSSLVLRNLLKDESFFLVLFLILLMVFYGAAGGIESRARVYEILFWVLMIPLFLMMLFAAKDVDVDYWTPVFDTSIVGVAAGSYYVLLCFSLIFLTLFLKQYLPDGKKVYQSSRSAVLFAGVLIGALYLLLLGIFGSNALATMDFPAVTMMSRVQITGGFLKRIDAFMFGIWFFTLYALLNSAVFYGSGTLAALLVIKEKKKGKWVIAIMLLLVYGCAWLFYHSNKVCEDYDLFLWYVGTPFVVVVPLILLLVKWLRGRKSQCAQEGEKESGADQSVRKTAGKFIGIFMVALLAANLTGCKRAEVEEKAFPVMLTVRDTEDFCKEWLNQQKFENLVVDYNHLKVIIFEQKFLEDEELMNEMLTILKQDKNVPENTYVLGSNDLDALLALEESMDEPLGNYLEELLENVSYAKKDAYPTLGMLYQEKENHLETLFIPELSVVDGKPVISSYHVWQHGTAGSVVDNATAMLSFFVDNQLDEFTLQLACNYYVRLTNPSNQIELQETILKSGVTQKEVIVHISCDGELLYQTDDLTPEESKELLESQLTEYFNNLSSAALSQGIDLTNSFKKLGGYQRSWYDIYANAPAKYEKTIQIDYQVDINWKNL